MTSGAEILEILHGLGVTVTVTGPDRLRLEPASRIPTEMVPRIRQAKPAILAALPSSDVEERFGQPHARLFPFIGHKVRTPSGPATLMQVFADRVTVLLDFDRDGACKRFLPAEIAPITPDG